MRFGACIALLGAGVALAAHVSDFDVARLVEGLPKTMDFLSRLVPPVRATHAVEDLAAWYWGAGKWLHLLASTLMMAFLATALGTAAGGVLSFAASRNLCGAGCFIGSRAGRSRSRARSPTSSGP